MRLVRCIILVSVNVLFGSLSIAHAENWVGLGLDEQGRSIYIDKHSIDRYGDIGTITGKLSGIPQKLTFDCVTQNYILPGNLELGMRERLVLMDKKAPKYITAAFDAACKRMYEFWK